ncbi:zinc finger MYM-type protein 1-like [Zingiber officinale]|uniref:zinc finger MYM-type protein 1-like n=1 Tax=Zingiber officinale TaxID=94328 RepID=UPI001C4B96E2|nr:zinc finger MYM-type protein 1-like [Zingiber officinale]
MKPSAFRLPFWGHDESSTSSNRGNFLELLKWYSSKCPEVAAVVGMNAPGNNQMIAPKIQKQLVNACAVETTNDILADLGDRWFTLLLDEARDCSVKEKMAVVIRYVNKHGEMIKRFMVVVHVATTTAACFKELVVVVVAQANQYVCDFIWIVGSIVNTSASSCKRADKLRQLEHDRKVKLLERGEISSGKELNQETSLARPGDTRWGFHHSTLCSIEQMWPSVIEVLQNLIDDGDHSSKDLSRTLVERMESYEFVFILLLMKHNINSRSRLKRDGKNVNFYHYYPVEIFCEVIDIILQEMDSHFSETTTDLLIYMSCLDPRNSFSRFDVQKLVRLAHFYEDDFSWSELMLVEQELETYIDDIRSDERFEAISDLGALAKKMIETMKNRVFPLVYRMIELALLLPVATAIVERVFSAMNIVKTDLRNRNGDE